MLQTAAAFSFSANSAEFIVQSASSPNEIEMDNSFYLPPEEEIAKTQELLRELSTVYNTNMPWLEAQARSKFEAIRNPMEATTFLLEGAFGILLKQHLGVIPINQREFESYKEKVIAIADWTKNAGDHQLPTLQAAFEAEVERVVRTASWWRRWFGG